MIRDEAERELMSEALKVLSGMPISRTAEYWMRIAIDERTKVKKLEEIDQASGEIVADMNVKLATAQSELSRLREAVRWRNMNKEPLLGSGITQAVEMASGVVAISFGGYWLPIPHKDILEGDR